MISAYPSRQSLPVMPAHRFARLSFQEIETSFWHSGMEKLRGRFDPVAEKHLKGGMYAAAVVGARDHHTE